MLTRAYGRHAKSTFHTWVRLIFKSKPNVRFVSQVLKIQKLTKAYEVLTRAYERHAKSILWIVIVILDGLCSFCPSVKEWPPLIILLRRGFLKQVIYVYNIITNGAYHPPVVVVVTVLNFGNFGFWKFIGFLNFWFWKIMVLIIIVKKGGIILLLLVVLL